MSRDLKNKTIIVTGGCHGLGYDIALKYLQKDAKVILLDIDENKGKDAVNTLSEQFGDQKVDFFKCDVTKDLEDVWKKIQDKYKTIDVLVNNAGILNEKSVRKTIDINLVAVIEWSNKFWEYARIDKGGKGGTIVNVASICGCRVTPYIPTYVASKFGVLAFTRALGCAGNFNRFGVRVVAICPGFTRTKLIDAPNTFCDEQLEELGELMKRMSWQTPDAVGNAAVEVFETADSGTGWVVEGGLPITPAVYTTEIIC